jgi:hypothetical protein
VHPKSLPKKRFFLGLVFQIGTTFLAKPYLGALFTKIKFTFLKKYGKKIFSFAIFEEKKVFIA